MKKVSSSSLSNSELLLDFSDIESREFGFFFSGTFRRKMQFLEKKALIKFISMVKPRDCFVSVARYENPRKMDGWIGSDFFVDIDIEDGNIKSIYNEALTSIDVLKNDFGLKKIILNKSGSKGYHVVVFDEVIQKLHSADRGEMIDYLIYKYNLNHIDAPCSCDIHRLRRLEGTINSKSGVICKRLLTEI